MSAAERVAIDSVKHYPGNPRTHDIDLLASSLAKHGQYKPIIVQTSTHYVLAGNGTLEAARDVLKWPTILVHWVDVDDEEAKAIVLVDNRASDLGGYDDEALAKLLKSLEPGALDGTGYSVQNLDALMASLTPKVVADKDLEQVIKRVPPEAAITKLGDRIVLGPHVLICGDSTDREITELLMTGEKADLVITDPPYLVDYESNATGAYGERRRQDGKVVTGDALTGDEADAFLLDVMGETQFHLKPGGVFYMFCDAGAGIEQFLWAARTEGLTVREILLWIKDRFTFGRQDYHWRHEAILYGWRDGAAHYFIADRTQDTLWDCPRPARSKEHPTMKPVDLLRRAIVNSSQVGDLVVDLFAGSGSTMAACIAEGRRCKMVELDPGYCDVIVARYELLSGEKVR